MARADRTRRHPALLDSPGGKGVKRYFSLYRLKTQKSKSTARPAPWSQLHSHASSPTEEHLCELQLRAGLGSNLTKLRGQPSTMTESRFLYSYDIIQICMVHAMCRLGMVGRGPRDELEILSRRSRRGRR